MLKNIASQKILFTAWNKFTGAYETGDAANITAQISKDGASPVDLGTTTVTEIGTSGVYYVSPTAAETNYDVITIVGSSTTADVVIIPAVYYLMQVMIGTNGALLAANVNVAVGVVEANIKQVNDEEVEYTTTHTGITGGDNSCVLDSATGAAVGKTILFEHSSGVWYIATIQYVSGTTIGFQPTVAGSIATGGTVIISSLIKGRSLSSIQEFSVKAKAEIEKECDDAITANAKIIAIEVDTGTTIPATLASIGAGSGAITFTYTVKENDGTGDAIPDVQVWVTSDITGNVRIASGTTDASGEVVFYLDADDYYVWRQKSGVNFTNPDLETVA